MMRLGGPFPDPGDGVEPVTGPGERDAGLAGVVGEHGVDAFVEPGDRGFEVGGVLQAQPDQQGVVVAEPPAQRLAQRGDLAAQPALGQLGEHLGVAFTGDQRGEHRPPGHAEHVRGDRVQLDPGVLQRLLDPLALAGVGLDEPFAVAGQVPQLADRRRGHEAAPQQAVFEQLGQPLGVQDVALAAGQDLHVVGVDQLQLERPLLEHVPDRFPVRAGGFHRDLGDALGGEPVGHRLQRAGERGRTCGSACAGPARSERGSARRPPPRPCRCRSPRTARSARPPTASSPSGPPGAGSAGPTDQRRCEACTRTTVRGAGKAPGVSL